MLLKSILLAMTIPLNLMIGSLVFMRQYKSRTGKTFGIAIFFVCWWALGDLMMLTGQNQNVITLGYYLFAIAPMYLSLYMLFFTYSVVGNRRPPGSIRLAGHLMTGTLTLIALLHSEFFIESITPQSSGMNHVVVNSGGYMVYTLFFTVIFCAAYVNLWLRYKQETGLQRTQIAYIFAGIALTSLCASVTNLTLPLSGTTDYLWLGPIWTFWFVVATSVAIVRHRLFDIRFIIARSLGYVLSILSLSAVYGVVSFYIMNRLIFRGSDIGTGQVFGYTVVAVALTFTFQPIKQFFDKITNRLFYRDAYDPQLFLNQLNSSLVNSAELERLLKQAAQLISETLKIEFCVFAIQDVGSKHYRFLGTTHPNFHANEIVKGYALALTSKKKVIVSDDTEGLTELKSILTNNNITMLCRLTESAQQKSIGFMMLGAKKSGMLFSQQDIKIVEIITDELTIAIQNALRFEEIENFNITLQEKVDNATRKLRQTNEKLRSLDETKDEFISMASHQLRTPLTSVKGYVSMVLEGDAGELNPMQRKLLDQAFISSQRMVYLIADLLNVSRLRTGKFVIESSQTNLADVVESEVHQLAETAKSRGLELSYSKPKDFPVLMLDETKVRQVIMNFIDNAIYYTPSGGHIRIELIDKPESVEYHVIDDGMGVAKADQHHLFTKFYRAGNARKARPDGTGLGLFMAKKVIVAQGGAIIFKSEEGKGSAFGFMFPKTQLSTPSHANTETAKK